MRGRGEDAGKSNYIITNELNIYTITMLNKTHHISYTSSYICKSKTLFRCVEVHACYGSAFNRLHVSNFPI